MFVSLRSFGMESHILRFENGAEDTPDLSASKEKMTTRWKVQFGFLKKEIFSRKAAKAQRKPFKNAAALCAFAALRERSSR
jgi:hypothetical protein